MPDLEKLPSSFAQQALWLHHNLAPERPLYNVPFGWELAGALDAALLRGCLDTIVLRHESLRTTFDSDRKDVLQVVHEEALYDFATADLCGEVDAWERARAELVRHAHQPFDLARGPLLRALLVRVEPERHLLQLTVHHIVIDGWSVGVVANELQALYTAGITGTAAALPDLPVQYADYAIWQREWLTGDVLKQRLDYWKKALAGAPPLLDLPLDRPRPEINSHRGGAVKLAFDPEAIDRLRLLCREQQATLFMALASVVSIWLHRYSDQAHVCIGYPVAGRQRPELKGLIGCFINVLVLHTHIDPRQAFSSLLKDVRTAVLDGDAHQDLPFENLLEELMPGRSARHAPLFQVMLSLNNTDEGALDLPGLSAAPLPFHSTVDAHYDLTVDLIDSGSVISGAIEYNADIFDRESVERMADHLCHLLSAVVRAPQAAIGELPMLDAAGQRRLDIGRKQAFEDRPGTDHAGAQAYVAPQTPVEALLTQIWAEVLGVALVGIHDNFFDLGGSSLMVMRMLSRLRTQLRREPTLQEVFRAPTVARLANLLDAQCDSTTTLSVPLAPAQGGRNRRPSSAQEGMLADLYRADIPGDELHTIRTAWRLDSAVAPAHLRTALDAVAVRHDALRCAFTREDDGFVVLYDDQARIPLEVIDLRAIARDERQVHRRVMDTLYAPLDPARAPLMRVYLYVLGERQHILATAVSHTISDGESDDIFMQELITVYDALAANTEPVLGPAPLQYSTFSDWQRRFLEQDPLAQRQTAYWRDRMAGMATMLPLPYDAPRPPVFQHREGAVVARKLDAPLVAALREQGARQSWTRYTQTIAGLFAMLSAETGERDVFVVTPSAGRFMPELFGSIGLYARGLVIRGQVDPGASCVELMAQLQERVLEAMSNQHVPRATIIAQCGPAPDASHTARFQVFFGYIQTGDGTLALGGAPMQPYPCSTDTTYNDLRVVVVESANDIEVSIQYCSALFKQSTVQRMLDCMVSAIDFLGTRAQPDQPVAGLLALLGDAKRHQPRT